MNQIIQSPHVETTQVDSKGVDAKQRETLEPVSTLLSKNLVTAIKSEEKADFNLKNFPLIDLDQPTMDPDTAIVIMMGLTDQIIKSDMKSTYLSLKSVNEFKNKVGQEKIKLMVENLKRAEEDRLNKEKQRISDDLGLGMGSAAAIFGFLGALIFTFATGGAGMPALIAAGIGLGMASLEAGTRIARESEATYADANGNKQPLDITLAGMVKRITEQLAHDHPDFPLGSTKENREKKIAELITGMSIFLNIAVAAATIALSVSSLRTVVKSTADVGKLTSDAARSASASVISQEARFASASAMVAQMSAEVAQAASMVTSGAFGIQLAFIAYDIKEVDNQKLEIDNFMKLLADEISTNQNFLAHLAEHSGQIYESMASTLSNYYQSQSKSRQNI